MTLVEHSKLFINTLFFGFPREIGFPGRIIVKTFDEFLKFAQYFHNESPVFIQLYKVNQITQEVKISKIWVDLDSHNQYKLISDLKIIHQKLLTLGFAKNDIVMPFTGNKGFHVYSKLKSKTYSIEDAKKYLFWINSWLCEDLETPDSPLFGDINRMVRVAGFLRPEGTLMISLNPEDIFQYSNINDYFIDQKFEWNKIVDRGSKYLKSMNGGANLDLKELYNKIKATGFKPPKKHTTHNFDKTSSISPILKTNNKGEYFDFLKKIITDIPLFYAIHSPNPRHVDRVRFAIKMLKTGLSINDSQEIIEGLRWIDYDSQITKYQLNHLQRKYEL